MEITVPFLNLPPVKTIKTIEIPLPTADVPSYVPLVVPPSGLKSEEPIEAETDEDTQQVAATLTATAAFKWAVTAMKPILKTLWKKISRSKERQEVSSKN